MTSVLAFAYDATKYSPPAPVVEIEIDGYDLTGSSALLTVLVDSGADATIIPLDVLQAVGAEYEDTVSMRGITDRALLVDRYTVAIRVGAIRIPAVHAVATGPGSEAIVGRDVLSHLVVTLDGPAGVTEIAT